MIRAAAVGSARASRPWQRGWPSAASWARIKQLVRELGLENPAREQGIVLRTKADCLRICAEGPILLIWPDGVIYGGVTAERIERILREHVIGGVPIETWVVGRNQFGSDTAELWNGGNRPGSDPQA